MVSLKISVRASEGLDVPGMCPAVISALGKIVEIFLMSSLNDSTAFGNRTVFN